MAEPRMIQLQYGTDWRDSQREEYVRESKKTEWKKLSLKKIKFWCVADIQAETVESKKMAAFFFDCS